jgi:hypothetical protein
MGDFKEAVGTVMESDSPLSCADEIYGAAMYLCNEDKGRAAELTISAYERFCRYALRKITDSAYVRSRLLRELILTFQEGQTAPLPRRSL